MEETIYSLYVHIFPNNKVYVGITCKTPEVRWGNNGIHYKTQTRLWNAIQKYGWDNIQHIIILQTKFKDEIEKQEKYFITEVYHSNERDKGYNVEDGGTYTAEYINRQGMSEEFRIKARERTLGENNPMYGKTIYTNGKENIILKKAIQFLKALYKLQAIKTKAKNGGIMEKNQSFASKNQMIPINQAD